MGTTLQVKENEEDEAALAIWDCGSPLYDSYELVSLSHLIERHLMTLPSLGGSRRLTGKFSIPSDVITSATKISNVDYKDANRCSTMSTLGEFVRWKLLKRRRTGQRKDKHKKLKTVGLGGFCIRFLHCGRNRLTNQ